MSSDLSDDDRAGYQFDIQLELEELDAEQIRERASSLRAQCPADRRLAISLTIWSVLMRSPVLGDEERRERLTAWCDGLGVPEADVWRAVEDIMKRRS